MWGDIFYDFLFFFYIKEFCKKKNSLNYKHESCLILIHFQLKLVFCLEQQKNRFLIS